jgi:hypothetical protein
MSLKEADQPGGVHLKMMLVRQVIKNHTGHVLFVVASQDDTRTNRPHVVQAIPHLAPGYVYRLIPDSGSVADMMPQNPKKALLEERPDSPSPMKPSLYFATISN